MLDEKILAVGHYGWWSLAGDWKTHLTMLRKCGVNALRIFGQYSWPQGRGTHTPFAVLTSMDLVNSLPWNPPLPNEEYRKDRYFYQDGRVWFRHRQLPNVILPVYDLSMLSFVYFDFVYDLGKYMAGLDMTLIYEVEDWCSLKHPNPDKYRHPYHVSPQAHSAITPGGLYGDALFQFMTPYWSKLIQALDASGVNFYLSIMNEYDNPWVESSYDYMSWYVKAKNFMVKQYSGVQFIASAMGHFNKFLTLGNTYWSQHGVGNADSYGHELWLADRWGLNLEGVAQLTLLSGDGFSSGTAGPDFKGRKGISIQEVPEICRIVNDKGYLGYEALIRYYGSHADGTYEDFDSLYNGYEIMTKFSDLLGTYKRPIPKPPAPPPPAPPAPPIEPPAPPELEISEFQKFLKWLGAVLRWLFGKNSLIQKFFKKIFKKT